MGQVGVVLVGVVSLGMESDVRTDWLSARAGTEINKASSVELLMIQRASQALSIKEGASQSSSLLSVRPLLLRRAWGAHVWSDRSARRNVLAAGSLRTASANGLDQVEMRRTHSGPDWLEIMQRALPMLSSVISPMIVAQPYGIGNMLGSLINLN